MPMLAIKDNEESKLDEQKIDKFSVTGSFIFEDIESGEVTMSIFRSKDS